jgi:hypothetical protein
MTVPHVYKRSSEDEESAVSKANLLPAYTGLWGVRELEGDATLRLGSYKEARRGTCIRLREREICARMKRGGLMGKVGVSM